MTTFNITKKIKVECEWKKTRMAFKHEATLFKNGQEIETTKICYQNRTWESYQFETVLNKLCEKTQELTTRQKNLFRKKIKNNFVEENKKKLEKQFGFIGAIASLGNVLCESKSEKNDWKARMIKAGMPSLSMPKDWDGLSEEVKEKRLNAVIGNL